MTDRELMEMALDALLWVDEEQRMFSQRESIRRLRDRLAQTEPESVLWERREDGKIGPTNALPKREWVELTDDEVFRLSERIECCRYSICAAEAKLKEKNT
jgi:hypothetical protein